MSAQEGKGSLITRRTRDTPLKKGFKCNLMLDDIPFFGNNRFSGTWFDACRFSCCMVLFSLQ